MNFILTCFNISTGQFAICVEMDSDEFTLLDIQHNLLHLSTLWNYSRFSHQMTVCYTYKARGVVIPHCLGITVGLQQGIGSNNLVLQ